MLLRIVGGENDDDNDKSILPVSTRITGITGEW